ncbi:MAG: hypothetical protein HYV37_02175 [Candidatus Levyibacteriota bacterium]|nr:MAG: hypothetical protein HYV37_02175 [Candidatus Levybacteria bacterium]
MKVKLLFFISICLFFLVLPKVGYAESNYVLPYPSFMPGTALYKLHILYEHIQKYWYFGNFSQFSYNLNLSNKYLVEAKTLFEYKQYLLAHQALYKSNEYFTEAYRFLGRSKQEGKDTNQRVATLKNASEKHREVLWQIKTEIPEIYIWKPEKEKQTTLFLWKQIDKAIEIRKNSA